MSRIPFQVGNSANSATFPRSRKITGPNYLMHFCIIAMMLVSVVTSVFLMPVHEVCHIINNISYNNSQNCASFWHSLVCCDIWFNWGSFMRNVSLLSCLEVPCLFHCSWIVVTYITNILHMPTATTSSHTKEVHVYSLVCVGGWGAMPAAREHSI